MLVQCVNGNVYLLINDTFIREAGQISLKNFTFTLKCGNKNFNIMKISKIMKDHKLRPNHWTKKTIDEYLLWSREGGEIDEKPLRKEQFDIESNTWTETS